MNALIIGTPIAVQSHFSGASRRVLDIANFLSEIGFDVEISKTIIANARFDLICIVSYANAKKIKEARSSCKVLWFDATDSWCLTHNSLRYYFSFKGWLRIIRDFIYIRRAITADFITFCSRRDLKVHIQRFPNALVFSHSQPNWRKLPNLGRRLVFVGPKNYGPNAEAFNFLVKFYEVNRDFNVPLFIYGSGYKQLTDLRINIIGNAKNEALYGAQDIHLAPLTSGAGVKYKTLTPVSLGLFTIATKEGANGLNTSQPNLAVVDNLEEFSNLLLNIDVNNIASQQMIMSRVLEEDDSKAIQKKCLTVV